ASSARARPASSPATTTSGASTSACRSHPEVTRVSRLDVLAAGLDRGRIVLHRLDVVERLSAGLLDHLRVERAQTADCVGELLRLEAEPPALEQPRRIGVRRLPEDRVRAGDERRPFGRIDDLDRLPLLLEPEQDVLAAVDRDGALAERDFLRRVGSRLD